MGAAAGGADADSKPAERGEAGSGAHRSSPSPRPGPGTPSCGWSSSWPYAHRAAASAEQRRAPERGKRAAQKVVWPRLALASPARARAAAGGLGVWGWHLRGWLGGALRTSGSTMAARKAVRQPRWAAWCHAMCWLVGCLRFSYSLKHFRALPCTGTGTGPGVHLPPRRWETMGRRR